MALYILHKKPKSNYNLSGYIYDPEFSAPSTAEDIN